jgi:serine/threonine protein kinase/DNA-binding beta-propeller fold protein YncE
VTLRSGTRLGPYEIGAQLGAGGMGEVYRAKDPRLGREVAVKVLPASFATDADRLKRFEQEARAAGVLNHPNITAVHDFGTNPGDGSPYIVTELLEGETLRSRLSTGSVPVRKALDWAMQLAKGLAAAHEKGIVHCDLKPENVFLTKDGRVKILDFGLAKLKVEKEDGGQTDLRTMSGATEPGVVLGTMGYMSPEQVRGKPADRRSDIFAFGTILYEMLSGQRAFRGDTAADTITAILTKEPPDLSGTNRDIHPGLDRIVRHCLEKNPEERFDSARDVAFDLEALSGLSTPTLATADRVLPIQKKKVPWGVAALAAILGAAIASPFVYSAGKKAGFVQPPSFKQITFSRGEVGSALFAPDGQTIVYSAGWEGKPFEVFINRPESPESRPFGLGSAEVLSISRQGEMAVSLNRHALRSFVRTGRLARISIAGGAPRDILDDVQFADWGPDGQSLAIVRDFGVKNRLEYPIGKVLFETTGWVGQIRVSPKGDAVAFVNHPFPNDDGGRISLVDRSGKSTDLTPIYATVQGLAWTPDGKEIWYTAAEGGFNRAVHAVPPGGGTSRLVGRVPGISTIRDISKDGRVLMTNESARLGILGRGPGDEKERELSWLDYSLVTDITPDGQRILITESGEGGGAGYSSYLRKIDGSPAVRLGSGSTEAFSPDGAWAISLTNTEKPQIVLLPTSVGEPRALSYEGVDPLSADFLADGKQIVFTASQAGHGTRLYLRGIDGTKSRALTPEGYSMFRGTITPDGKSIVVRGPDQRIYLYPLAGGEPHALPGLSDKHRPARFSADGKFLYVQEDQTLPLRVDRYEMATGRLELWKELTVADAAGLNSISRFVVTPDGKTYAYSYLRILSYLQLVEGMK